MTTAQVQKKPRAAVRDHGLNFQAQCSCGWRGPDTWNRERAVEDKARHMAEGVHRGVFAGEWMQRQQWGPICDLQAGDRTLVFDPPDALWPAGGQRIRVEDYDTDRPILAVESFDRDIHRHGMKYDEPAAQDGGQADG